MDRRSDKKKLSKRRKRESKEEGEEQEVIGEENHKPEKEKSFFDQVMDSLKKPRKTKDEDLEMSEKMHDASKKIVGDMEDAYLLDEQILKEKSGPALNKTKLLQEVQDQLNK